MATLRLSQRAESDLYNIGLYTFRTWGEAQTNRYISKLEACCQLLAENPKLGRACDEVRRGLRRMEEGTHVVFYREEPGGVFISRILHKRMLPENLPVNEDEEAAGLP